MKEISGWTAGAMAVAATCAVVGLLTYAAGAQEIKKDLQDIRQDRQEISGRTPARSGRTGASRGATGRISPRP